MPATFTATQFDVDDALDNAPAARFPRAVEPIIRAVSGLSDQQLCESASWCADALRDRPDATLEDLLVARILRELAVRYSDRVRYDAEAF